MTPPPDLTLETRLWAEGYRVVGCDEAGRGTWAGSLWVGAVSLRKDDLTIVSEMLDSYHLRDSKQMTPKQRAVIYRMILETGIPYAVADATVGEIDSLGIERAFVLALNRAGSSLVDDLSRRESAPADVYAKTALLIDGARYRNLTVTGGTPLAFEVVAEDKLDQTSATVALASVVAKVHAEITMLGMGQIFPEYGFAKHGGYVTKAHREAVAKHGLSVVHRKTWNVDLEATR